MPDILIRMEMPEIKNNHGIKAELRRIDGRLEIGFMTGGYSCCEQWTYYPIHELPPHGDLISRDEAVLVLQSIGSRDYRREKGTICDAIKMISHERYVPAIVPASEEVDGDV